jgi:N-acetylmuramoyl-L-alanine amidase
MFVYRLAAGRGATLLATLSLLFFGACASGPAPRGHASGAEAAPRPQPAPAGFTDLQSLARRHELQLRAGTEKIRLERNGRRAEISRASRVAYVDGNLVLMSSIPEARGERVFVAADFGQKLEGWARLASRPLPPTPKAKRPAPRPMTPVVASMPAPRPARDALSRLRVMIDAGHGGKDPGALSAQGLREKDIALAVALDLRDRLERAGAEVSMTRSTDRFISLDRRTALARQRDIDAFVSIHANGATNRQARGIEVFRARRRESGHRADKLEESTRLARALYSALTPVSPYRDRGVKDSPGFRVLRKNRHPAALVELGFLTNSGEAKLLGQARYRRELTQSLVEGLRSFAAGL